MGVIIMNMSSFVIVPQLPNIVEGESIAGLQFSFAALVVMAGKARSVFALLFGVGFAILLSRAEQRGGDFSAFYKRRLGFLLLIGMLNMLFLYWGDILILYALMGFVLLRFRQASDALLLLLGIAFAIVPSLIHGIFLLVFSDLLQGLGSVPPADLDALMGQDLVAYIQANAVGYLGRYVNDPVSMLVYVLHVLGMFLLGLWCVRKGMVDDLTPHRPLLRRLFWAGLLPGLVLSALFFLSYIMEGSLSGAFKALVYTSYIGVPILAVSYASGLMLLFTGQSSLGSMLRDSFAPAGRMALTGYLGANALGGLILYGWGFGTMQSWGMMTSHWLGLGIFLFLAVVSALWLKLFRFGPAKWVWRSATYGRIQPALALRQA